MYDRIDPIFPQEVFHQRLITNIAFDEMMSVLPGEIGEVIYATSVGQRIQVPYVDLRFILKERFLVI